MKKAALLAVLMILSVAVWAQKTKVVITTDYGKITMMLYDNTPKHRDNMIKLIKEKFYDGTLFHRVIPGFMIQAGDPDSKTAVAGQALGEGDLKYKIPAEINDENFHQRGALAMARDENPEKESSACQFYIVVGRKYTDAELDRIAQRNGRKFSATQRELYKTEGGTPNLDGRYTVFGMVLDGMDVVDKIVAEPRDSNDRPKKDIHIIDVRIVKKHKFLIF